MEQKDFKYSDITQKIIGAAMKVHFFLAWVFRKSFIKEALIIELEKIGL